MFVKANIHQAVIAAPAINVNHADHISFSLDDGLQYDLGRNGENFSISAAASLEP